ncbi:MAG: hypothetical protein AB7V39_00540 [Nitrospiraceae bacterium]
MEYLMKMCPAHGPMVSVNGAEVCLLCQKPTGLIVSEKAVPMTDAEKLEVGMIKSLPQVPAAPVAKTFVTGMTQVPVSGGAVQDIINAVERLTMPSDLKKCKTVLKIKQLAMSLLEE